MRVVCDNCGAVYKIGDGKLVKDVNKATCKRCGYKIVIFKPGANPGAGEGAFGDSDENTVIKNVSELEQMGRSQGVSVPSIGSLTAELRAISLPTTGATPAVPAAPSLAGIGLVTGPSPAVPAPPPPPPPAPQPMAVPTPAPQPVVFGGAPASPPPLAPTPAARAVPPGPLGPPNLPPMAPLGGPGPRPSGPTVARTGEAPAVRHDDAPTAVSRLGGPAAMPPGVLPGPVPSAAPSQHSTAMAVQAVAGPMPGGDGAAADLGFLGAMGFLGIIGIVAASVAPHPLSAVGAGCAAFAAGTTLFLPMLGERGRRPGKAPLAMVMGLFIGGGLAFFLFTQGAPQPTDELEGVEVPPAEPPAPLPTPEPTPPPPPSAAAGLTEDERLALEASAAPTPEATPPAAPTPKPVAAASPVVKTPTRPEPTPTPKVEEKAPTPAPPTTAKSPSAPAAPASSSSSNKQGLSSLVIDTMLRTNAEIRRCFATEKAKGTDIAGKIYVQFSVAPEGAASRARITTSRFAGSSLDSCVSKEVEALKFPPFEGDTQKVTYAFVVN